MKVKDASIENTTIVEFAKNDHDAKIVPQFNYITHNITGAVVVGLTMVELETPIKFSEKWVDTAECQPLVTMVFSSAESVDRVIKWLEEVKSGISKLDSHE